MDRRTESGVQPTSAFPRLDATDPAPAELPEPIEEARRGLEPGPHLAFEEDGAVRVVPLAREWTRIGRSLAADVRFDDATVSRRHALIVWQADGVRILDDRSLNGVYVNDERVEWSPLRHGDRIAVGRHSLWFLQTSDVPAGLPARR